VTDSVFRDRVWSRMGEIDWSRYENVLDDVVDRAHAALYAEGRWTKAPIEWFEDMVMAITGDPEPDALLVLFAQSAVAIGLGEGVYLADELDLGQREAVAFAVAAVMGVRDKQTEIEEADRVG
jgi:hypothetical protein